MLGGMGTDARKNMIHPLQIMIPHKHPNKHRFGVNSLKDLEMLTPPILVPIHATEGYAHAWPRANKKAVS
jgi:hypothetical protein